MGNRKLAVQSVRNMNSTPLSLTEDKFATDLSGGRKSIKDEFMEIPTTQIIPFTLKKGKDFSRPDAEPDEVMIQTVKDYGIIEAVTVRPLENTKQFELLAGETRWLAAKAAGLTTIPAHIMHVSDAQAHEIFAITNLCRRDLKPLDKVYGWWHVREGLKLQGKEDKMEALINDGQFLKEVGYTGEKISWRQVKYYLRMNDLSPEWLERYGNGELTLKSGSLLLNLPSEVQKALLDYTFTEREFLDFFQLYNDTIDDGKEWDPRLYGQLLHPIKEITPSEEQESAKKSSEEEPPEEELTPEQKQAVENAVHFRKIKKSVVRAAEARLRPEDYDNAEEVIGDALMLYYETRDKMQQKK